MAFYKVQWKPAAERELRRVDRAVIKRIVDATESLAENPFGPGVRKLVSGENEYRKRVGDYRIIFQVFQDRLIIEIVRVGHRRDVYR